jgi:hypothetical protein
VTELRRGRPFVVSMAREEGGAAAMVRGAALNRLGKGGREEGKRGCMVWWVGSSCWAGLVC